MSKSQYSGQSSASEREAARSAQQMREARVTITDADLETIGIDELVSVWRDAGLRHFETIECHENGAIVQVSVARPLPPERLATIQSVDSWEYISSAGDTEEYLVEFTAPKFPPSLAAQVDEVVDTCDPELAEHGITVSLVGPQQAISDLIRTYRSAGLSPSLRKLGPFRGREQPLDTLTKRQRDVLKTAFEMGYYEVPRKVSSEDIATEMELEASTVSEHLQRAERNLLTQHLSPVQSVSSF